MRLSSINRLLAPLMLALTLRAHAAAVTPVKVELDATQAPTGVLHSHLTFQAAAGSLTLAYPKWIPGEHGPSGPLSQMVKLQFFAKGAPIPWHRDDVDPYVFHVDVPKSATEVRADLDFACVLGQAGLQSDICNSYDQVVVIWSHVLLYPLSLPNDRSPFTASVRLPPGWRHASALPVDGTDSGDTVIFKTVPLKTLVDSPVMAAEHMKSVPLGGQRNLELDISAESEVDLAITPEQVGHFAGMVAEAEAIFDGPRYSHYNMLFSLGDSIDHYTLEHLESSDIRIAENGLADPRVLVTTASMIPHEYVHSWNGKNRTPVGLDIKTYQDPMKAGLIWVYEGLTDYISNILTARSGFWTEDQLAQSIAIDVAQMTYHTGRVWRPLQDITTGVQMLLTAPNATANGWSSARRNADFYPESGLMWLEADALIRQESKGQRSIDDFCKAFFGSAAGNKPYTFDDVLAAMNRVLPYDWRRFFRSHLDSLSPQPPLGGVERAGWKMVYTEQKSELIEDLEQIRKVDMLWPEWSKAAFTDQRYSIGLLLQDDGTVLDSAQDMSGYNAGIITGMQVVGVNGSRFSLTAIEEGIRRTKQGASLDVLVANGNSLSSRRIDYHDGLKYPHLVRDPSKPDILQLIAAPQARATAH